MITLLLGRVGLQTTKTCSISPTNSGGTWYTCFPRRLYNQIAKAVNNIYEAKIQMSDKKKHFKHTLKNQLRKTTIKSKVIRKIYLMLYSTTTESRLILHFLCENKHNRKKLYSHGEIMTTELLARFKDILMLWNVILVKLEKLFQQILGIRERYKNIIRLYVRSTLEYS
jgi:hypothetical protein